MASKKFRIKIFKTILFGRYKNKCYCEKEISGDREVWIRYKIVPGGTLRLDEEYNTQEECVMPCK